jgi:transposase
MRPSSRSTKAPSTRSRRDLAALERRRRQAATLFERGDRQADIARQLKVSRQAVSRWHKQWRAGGLEALQKSVTPGRPRRLEDKQLAEIEAALLQGARAHGYPTELWTLRRVSEVIAKVSGIEYHAGHVWRILRGLGWSRQKPARRAAERDPEKIEAWVKERWPELKRGSNRSGAGSSSRTRAASR